MLRDPRWLESAVLVTNIVIFLFMLSLRVNGRSTVVRKERGTRTKVSNQDGSEFKPTPAVLLVQALGGGWYSTALPERPECCGKQASATK